MIRIGIFVAVVTYVAALPDVMELLTQHPEASTAVDLIKQAGLESMLQQDGPYTLIVPTNDAFAKVPQSDLDALKADNNMLNNTLGFHLLPGMHFTWDMRANELINTSNGHSVHVYTDTIHSQTFFNQAKVVAGELQASNGVIYFVDEVLNVPEGSVLDIVHNPDYNTSIFYSLIQRLHMTALYDGARYQETVFVPTDEAFHNLPQTLYNQIMHSTTYARYIVEYHTHRGIMHASSIDHDGSIITNHRGHTIHVTHDSDDIILNNVAHVLIPDIEADNGVVHVISHVLIPSNVSPSVIG